ncbi:MAG: Rrf2 family transcriptional regulator [Candidatus Omnitrophica bacterium]|jgi:Rrf2 family protein|nr:Rrf2 family transcriptional regulator [Candidatus Omnitrophota bacterium]
MKLITRDTDYALRSLIYIQRHSKKIIPVSELVKNLGIPRPFLRKITQVLCRNGLLGSIKGPGGGFKLTPGARNITLEKLMCVFQGPFRLNECSFKKMPCPNTKTCFVRKKIQEIESYVRRQLKGIRLSQLIRGN